MKFAKFLPTFDQWLSEFHEEFQKIVNMLQILRNIAGKFRKILEIYRICADFICSFLVFQSYPHCRPEVSEDDPIAHAPGHDGPRGVHLRRTFHVRLFARRAAAGMGLGRRQPGSRGTSLWYLIELVRQKMHLPDSSMTLQSFFSTERSSAHTKKLIFILLQYRALHFSWLRILLWSPFIGWTMLNCRGHFRRVVEAAGVSR